jgi:ParB family chromosome partitioning protein
MPRQTLGRGLSALLGDDKLTSPQAEPFEIDIDLIDPNPDQPRTRFTEENLNELAQSIRANGVVQPIVLRKRGDRYQIVAGERRWRASQRAELRRIPAIVKEVSDEKLLELALIENIQRQDLNPIEEAKAYRKLIETVGLTQEKVAEQVGKERSVVTTSLRLLKLPGEIQRAIETGALSAGHGRALLTIDDSGALRTIANLAIDNGWSVRETERAAKKAKDSGVPREAPEPPRADPNVKAAETRLKRSLNTNVRILEGKKKNTGKIEIEYYSMDDLDRVYRLIVGNKGFSE